MRIMTTLPYDVESPLVGVIRAGEVVEVPDDVAAELLGNGAFVEAPTVKPSKSKED